jgi:hypothetical protein
MKYKPEGEEAYDTVALAETEMRGAEGLAVRCADCKPKTKRDWWSLPFPPRHNRRTLVYLSAGKNLTFGHSLVISEPVLLEFSLVMAYRAKC